MTRAARRQSGFTLIELMTTLSVCAILTLVAIPSFAAFKRSAELSSAANGLLAAIAAARTEAMKRNLPAMVVPRSTGWASGWQSFVDVNRNGAFDSGDILINSQPALPSYFSATGTGTASGSTPYMRFDGSGFSRNLAISGTAPTGGTNALTVAIARTDVSGNAVFDQTRYLILALTGRARVCKPASANDSSCGTSSVS